MKLEMYDAEGRIVNMTYDPSGQPILTTEQAMGRVQDRHGARIAYLRNGRNRALLIQQTKYTEVNGQYVIDHPGDRSKIERHVKWDDDQAIADAIRAAVEGKL